MFYSNRKRKPDNLPSQAKQIKRIDNGIAYTLNEATNSSQDNTTVEISFNEFSEFNSEDEDGEPTIIASKETELKDSAEDNDCIIVNEQKSAPIIDLSDEDEDPESQDGSGKMIELILCNDIDPEPSEMAEEFEIEIINQMDNQEVQQPLRINFTTIGDAEANSNLSIDLTDAPGDENVNCESNRDSEANSSSSTDLTIAPSDDNVNCDARRMMSETETETDTVDLTDEPQPLKEINSDEPITIVTERIKRKLDSWYPGIVQSIVWNDTTKQFEVSIGKNNRFNNSIAFHQYLLEVVNQELKRKKSLRKHSEPSNLNGDQATEKTISNKVYALKEQDTAKCSETVTKAPTNSLNGNSSSRSNIGSIAQLACKTQNQIISNYMATRILKKSESYLGISTETFQRIEILLSCRSKIRPLLILLFRKIKLNETFSILSDMLCPNNDDCINTFNEFLIEVSRTLNCLLRWPTNGRESLAIVDLFEIEIEKPNSIVDQTLSFCPRRQRYYVKFIISCTSTGYFTYVSAPFYSNQNSTFTKCLASIPKSYTIVAHPDLFDKKMDCYSRIVSLFDVNRQAERNVIQRLFKRLRAFSLINDVSDVHFVDLLQHTVSLVACLCNLEGEEGREIKC